MKSQPSARNASDPFTNSPKVSAANATNNSRAIAGQISASALKQIAALETEKANRTPVQQRIDSQLLYADKMRRGIPIADGIQTLHINLDKDAQGRILVDIKAQVTDSLLQYIRDLGGNIVNSFAQYNAIRANVPLSSIESVASRPDVKFVQPAVRTTHSNIDSEGDYTHAAITARSTFDANGSGVKVGVLSDSVDYLNNSQVAGQVTVLAGQDGLGQTGEGTAMLEIVNDLAPGAQLYFATGDSGEASFANNIRALASAGCNIIVDDELYDDESPFQDGIIAQAVNSVTTNGVLYFSSASNAGNEDSVTSGTWEGDFLDSGDVNDPSLPANSGHVHSFGNGALYDTVIANGPGGDDLRVDLFWSDPLGGSSNDYDLYVLDASATTVIASSTNPQTGTQDPYESISSVSVGEVIVIVKYSGIGRFLHLSTGRGELGISTAGSTRGHNCAVNGFGVAATDAAVSYPLAFMGGAVNPVESFSSDGPRRVFFQPNGVPITPGNFSSSGGTVLQKPDITAADDVTTDVPGFQPFTGTSAAAPHSAAIAALLKSYNPALTTAQIRTILTGSALDIMARGKDRDSGAGIVMASAALQNTPPPPRPDLTKKTDNLNDLQPSLGETVTATITVANEPCSGGNASAGNFHVGFYWSTDPTFTGVSPFYETFVSGCGANGSVTITQNITIVPQNTLGTHYLGYKINDENEVTECNTGNNGIFYWTVNVQPPDTIPPTVIISSPIASTNLTVSPTTIQGTASDNVAVASVWYQLNGGPWLQANGTTSWSAIVALLQGTNNLSVYAVDPSGNISMTNSVSFTFIPSGMLTVAINGPGVVSPNPNGQILPMGKAYTLSAKADKGCKFIGWTGSFASNSPKLKFILEPNLALTANFVDVTPPILVVSYPAAKHVVTNSVINASGKAKDNVAVESVFYQFNTNGWALAAGTTNWSTTNLELVPGTNVISAFAEDAAGNSSRTNTISFKH